MNTKPYPPRWAQKILARLHPEDTLEEVEGDLEELYAYWYERGGRTQATLRYLLNVISVLPPFVRKRKTGKDYYTPKCRTTSNLNPDMIRNYFKVAWRNLRSQVGLTFTNVFGLSLGISCVLLVLLWVKDELNIDRFHKNNERIYLVKGNKSLSGQDISTSSGTPSLLAENLKKDFAEVEKAAVLASGESILLTAGTQFGKEKGGYASQDFLSIFSYPLLKGDAGTALSQPDGIVISDKLAKKYFPGQDPVGKIIRMDNTHDLSVTGVLDVLPPESSLKFDYLIAWERFVKDHEWVRRWDNDSFHNYILLNKQSDPDKLSAKLKNYLAVKTNQAINNTELFLQKNSDAYLYSKFKNGVQDGGRIEYIRLFIIIAGFVLLIACINFINLVTAGSARRAKEIGIRKVVGAGKGSLIGQFMGESLLTTLLASVTSIVIVKLILPQFNLLTGKEISLELNWDNFLVIAGILVLTGLLAGSYPAMFLSSLKPVSVLKGRLKFKSGATFFRKSLVVFQFSLSIILIVGILIIYRQIEFIQTKNLGFNRESMIYFPLEGDLKQNYQDFRNELLFQTGIKSVSCSWSDPLKVNNSTTGITWPGKDTTEKSRFSYAVVHYGYLETMGIQLKEGRDFSTSFSLDTSNYIINEEAARKLGYKEPIGKELTFWGRKGTIIGVVKNYHINSLHVSIEPLILQMQRKNFAGVVVVRTEGGNTQATLAALEKTFLKFNSKYPFEFKFTDQEFEHYYKTEMIISRLASYFSFLAIFLSCLGLFGLTAFIAQQKTKEIGVRKVLGASVINIIYLFSAYFLKLVAIAMLLAFPVAWYLMDQWLQDFAYKIDIEWWMFALTGAAVLVVALLTVSFQSVKAALIDPVKSLKSE